MATEKVTTPSLKNMSVTTQVIFTTNQLMRATAKMISVTTKVILTTEEVIISLPLLMLATKNMISVTTKVIFVTFVVADISLFVVAEIIFKEDVITFS